MFSDSLRVLHIAPEPILRKRLSAAGNLAEYLTADLNRRDVDIRFDVTNIPLPQEHFDVILCNHVLEHVENDRRAMTELYRILRPGGWASLMVPISRTLHSTLEDPSITLPQDRERMFGQDDHLRLYASDFKSRLEEAGFTVVVEDYGRELGELRQEYGLDECEELYLGTKARTTT